MLYRVLEVPYVLDTRYSHCSRHFLKMLLNIMTITQTVQRLFSCYCILLRTKWRPFRVVEDKSHSLQYFISFILCTFTNFTYSEHALYRIILLFSFLSFPLCIAFSLFIIPLPSLWKIVYPQGMYKKRWTMPSLCRNSLILMTYFCKLEYKM